MKPCGDGRSRTAFEAAVSHHSIQIFGVGLRPRLTFLGMLFPHSFHQAVNAFMAGPSPLALSGHRFDVFFIQMFGGPGHDQW